MKANLKRHWRDTTGWVYHGDGNPSDLCPEYFDNIARDLVDVAKYFDDDPIAAGVGERFTLMIGDVPDNYYVAEFEIDQLYRTLRKGRSPEFHLRWHQRTPFRHVTGDYPGWLESFDPPRAPLLEIKWNPGKKVHQLLEGGEVVFESADKEEVEKRAA